MRWGRFPSIVAMTCCGCGGLSAPGHGDATTDSSTQGDGHVGADALEDVTPGSDAGSTDATTAPDGTVDAGPADSAPADAPRGDGNILDPTFGDGGLIGIPYDAGPDAAPGLGSAYVSAIVVRSDGRFVVALQSNPSNQGVWIAQVLADGSAFDSTFAGGGLVAVPNGTYAGWYGGRTSLALAPNGSVVVAYGCAGAQDASTLVDTCVVRLTPAGQIDTTWGTSGVADVTSLGSFWAAVVDATGSVWLASGNPNVGGLAVLDSNGLPDLGPGGNGRANVAAQSACVGVGIQSTGRIVVGCGDPMGGLDLFGVTATGDVDPTFAAPVRVVTPQVTAVAMAVNPDDSLMAVGYGPGSFAAARFTANGALDTGFAAGGSLNTLGDTTSVAGVAALGQDDFAVSTASLTSENQPIVVIKLAPTGIDTSYGVGGFGTVAQGGLMATAIAAQGNGLLVAGAGLPLARVNP